MTKETLMRFQATAPLKLPSIIEAGSEDVAKREIYEDYVLMHFNLPHHLPLHVLLNDAEESYGTTLLYNHFRSEATDFGQSFCLFQEPGTGEMFEICGSTDSRGFITDVEVRLFTSLELMLVSLRQELRRMADSAGNFRYRLSEPELMAFFL